jgi:HSP20 family protein
MPKNGDVTVRDPLFPDIDRLRDALRFDARWPFALHALRPHEHALAPVDMFERDGDIVVKAEMPGIEPGKIDVTVVNGELRISGEREEEKEVKEEHYYHSERTFGRIFRTVALPEGCDVDNVRATVKDGVLEVAIPKKGAAPTKKIEVTTA